MKELTWEQILKIVVSGTRDLSIHEGECNVLQRMYEVAKDCDNDKDPWVVTADEVKLWAKEAFNINIK